MLRKRAVLVSCSVDSVSKADLSRLKPLQMGTWPGETMYFGLAIQLVNPANGQFHTATLYRFGNRLMIGDVQNHLRSRRADALPSNSLFWIWPAISEEDQRILAAKVDDWLENNEGKIPYSVAHPGGVIFKDSVWVGNQPGQGLTCATFVIALFNELGIPFLDEGTWEQRPGDDVWAEGLLRQICAEMTDEHIEAQLALIGATVRVRPSDVAAAGLLIAPDQELPLTFQDVEPIAAEIEKSMLD